MARLPNNSDETQNPADPTAWVRLARAATTETERRAALYQALCLAPYNERIVAAFRSLHTVDHYRTAAQQDGAMICYHRADEIFAAELAEALKARRLPAWIDIFDVTLDADWNETVRAAMRDSGVVLLILSPEAVASEITRGEVAYSLEAGKLVLPLLYRDCDTTPLKLMHPVIDFRADYKSALRMVFALLGIPAHRA